MSRRSRFSRICRQVVSFFRNIRSSLVEIWNSVNDIRILVEDDSLEVVFRRQFDGNRHRTVLQVLKKNKGTDCEQLTTIDMDCQTDADPFADALNALGQSADDCTMTRQNKNKRISEKTPPSLKNSEGVRNISNNAVIFNENLSVTENARSPNAKVQTTPSRINRSSPSKRRNYHTHPVGFRCIANTIYHGSKRSIGTLAVVECANASSQTFLSIPAKATFLPVPESPSFPAKWGETEKKDDREIKIVEKYRGDKLVETQDDNNTNKQKSMSGKNKNSVFHFGGAKSAPANRTHVAESVKRDKTTESDKREKSMTPIGVAVKYVDTPGSKEGGRDGGLIKDEMTKNIKDDNNMDTNLTDATNIITNAKDETKAATKPKYKVETMNEAKKESSVIPNVETKVVTPHCNSPSITAAPSASQTDGKTEEKTYTRENYIKVMLLKIVEKIPHIKKMKARQDSLPEDDLEREPLHQAINNEIKKNINHGLNKFYSRFNELSPTERANTTEMEKTFLMELIAEMKKADKDFLAEERRVQEVKQIRHEIVQKNTNKLKEQQTRTKVDIAAETRRLEAAHNELIIKEVRERMHAQELKQVQQLKRHEPISEMNEQSKSAEATDAATSKPKHPKKFRHRKAAVTESLEPHEDTHNVGDVSVPDPTQRTERRVIRLENAREKEETTHDVEETSESESGSNEDGAIMDFMRDIENEARRDGLFTNWDATPFGDIAESFDRGHYRIDGQTMVSKGSRGHKVEERHQKVKRRGIPNKHLANTSNFVQENAGDGHGDWVLVENEAKTSVSDDYVILEEQCEGPGDDNIAHETIASLDLNAFSVTEEEKECMVDSRHLQDMPCDVIMKKKGECDLLEEKYAVGKPQKAKAKQKKKKQPKKATLYAINFSNNADDADDADDESDSDEYDDTEESDDDSDQFSDDESGNERNNAVGYQARIDKFTAMLQSSVPCLDNQ